MSGNILSGSFPHVPVRCGGGVAACAAAPAGAATRRLAAPFICMAALLNQAHHLGDGQWVSDSSYGEGDAALDRIPHGIKGFVIPTKSLVKIGITKIFCYNSKMLSSINKTYGC